MLLGIKKPQYTALHISVQEIRFQCLNSFPCFHKNKSIYELQLLR